MKRCTKCGVTKELELFPRCHAMKDGKHSWCKACHSKKACEWQRTANPARVKQNKRSSELMRVYGLTELDYQQLLDKQSGGCALCGEPCATGKNLAVDHCHTTGRIRGLLCLVCNTALGKLGDTPERLRVVLNYVEGTVQ